jgi:hypothetical protein
MGPVPAKENRPLYCVPRAGVGCPSPASEPMSPRLLDTPQYVERTNPAPDPTDLARYQNGNLNGYFCAVAK